MGWSLDPFPGSFTKHESVVCHLTGTLLGFSPPGKTMVPNPRPRKEVGHPDTGAGATRRLSVGHAEPVHGTAIYAAPLAPETTPIGTYGTYGASGYCI